GKSFTSMCCAVEMNAKFVLIVSAKADVKNEWKKTVESHVKFDGFNFLDSNSLLESETIIKDKLEANEKVALFLTLQDLQGDDIKTKHKEVFENQIDLLLIDETHFGARALEYGKVLKELKSKKELKSETELNDESLDELEETTKTINSKIRIHLSGTPYRILMNSEFTTDDIIAFYQFTNIADDQQKWDNENLTKDDTKEWENPYYGFPQMIRFAFNPNESSRQKMEELKKLGVTYAFS
ncbi:MAG TPA: restriction endonuclease, partial [Xanthomarina gelatinilytica]|nr:restriction endonuclease [Xanthomarina gelatinilytica]